MPQTKNKATNESPPSRENGSSRVYSLVVLAMAGLLAVLWWQSGHLHERKNAAVRDKHAVNAVKEIKLERASAPVREQPAPIAQQQSTAPPPASVHEQQRDPVSPQQTPAPAPQQPSVLPSVLATTNQPTESTSGFPRPVRNVLEAQIALIEQGISPGSLDGAVGSQTRAALRAFQWQQGLTQSGELDAETKSNLMLQASPFTNYSVTAEDLARLQPIAPTWIGKSQQTALDFETILELVAEKTMSHPNLIKRLNPSMDWTNVSAGTVLQVPNAAYPENPGKAAWVTIHLNARTMEAFDSETNLIAHFPCSIAKHVEKRPVGLLQIQVVAPHPNYTFDPAVFPESPEAQQLHRKLILPPGPNNPVGVAWIGLDRPGYGIHGTPLPETVGRTESHGCFRLANWNAEFLLRLVTVGTPVYVVE